MPQLDGVRAIAVAAVVAQHYKMLIGGAGPGVQLFFVLSGFLITRILLAERANVTTMGITHERAFRQFYVRRMLRIFPLYYFIVILGIAFNVRNARAFAPWLLTYTFNLRMASLGVVADTFVHFWSLAVEEQYYLVWPWIILLLPRRLLKPAALVTIAIAPLFRVYLALFVDPSPSRGLWGYLGTPSALDNLGIGSLVAILLMDGESSAELLRRSMKWGVPIISLAFFIVLRIKAHGVLHYAFLNTATAAFFAWLVYTASRGFSGITGKILASAPLVFIGKISYGIYVYHPYVPAVLGRIAKRFGTTLPIFGWKASISYSAITIAVATVSWYTFERPINRLKRKFPYPAISSPKPARQSSG
jgi:peptidoglycan/LPS O-acetylase OafA/YrhL